MSKKVVRNRESYIKNWTAAITGSFLLVSAQAAQAGHENRVSFRDFKDNNPGIDRSALRQIYRQENGRNSASAIGICPVTTGAPNAAPSVTPVHQRHNQNSDKWSGRLERNDGVVKQSLQNNGGNLVNLKGGVDLDLTSQDRNITLGHKLFGNTASIEIEVGGEKKTLTAGSQVTAAEYIAAKQVLAGVGQKVTITGSGNASGGDVDLSAITSQHDKLRASDLVVPVNVTATGDFSKGSEFRLIGDLSNSGTVNALDSSGRGRGGTLRADDITNNAGGLISSSVDLTLRADGSVTNLGTISSNGNLTLNSSDITNRGSVSSAKDVTLTASSDSTLNVDNAGGTISAANAINVRSADYSGSANSNLNGGDFLSQTVNLYAGNGVVTGNVGNVTGAVNGDGYGVHFTSSADTLNIGNLNLIDPTFYNHGNINFTGSVSVAEDLTIIATGNITESVVGAFNIDTTNGGASATGGNLTMIAGANITSPPAGGGDSPSLPTANPGASVTFNQGSISGGSILLGNANITTNGTSNGGNVLLAAFAGTTAGSGAVNLANGITTTGTTINSGGTGGGTNGDVTIIGTSTIDLNAGGNGSITTAGGTGGGGAVSIFTAQPTSTGPVTYGANGALVSGQLVAGATLVDTTVDLSSITANGAVDVQSGGSVTALNINSNSNISLRAGIDASGNIINNAATLTLNGDINALDQVQIRTADNLVQNNNNDINGNTGVLIEVGINNASAPGGADYTQNGQINSALGGISVTVGDSYTVGNGAGDSVTAELDLSISTGVVSGAGNLTVNAPLNAGNGADDANILINVNGDFQANANGDITAGQGGLFYQGGVAISAHNLSTAAGADILGNFVALTANSDTGGDFDLAGNVTANGFFNSQITLTQNGSNFADIADNDITGGLSAALIELTNNTPGGTIQILNNNPTTINFNQVTANANGDITLVEPATGGADGNIDFFGSSNSGGTFTVLADGNITSSSGAIGGVTGNITSNTGNIGVDANNRLNVNFDNFRVQALGGPSATAGNAFISESGDLNFTGGDSQVTGTLDITGSGNITTGAGTTVRADNLVLATTGNIGNGVFDPLVVDAGSSATSGITANATGNVAIFDINNARIAAASGAGTGSLFSVVAQNDLAVDANVSANDTILASQTGNVNLAAGVTVNGDNSIVLTGNQINSTATSTVTGGDLTVNFQSASVTLKTDVDSVSSVGANGDLTINEANGIAIGSQSGIDSLVINANQTATGDVTTNADFTVGSLTVNTALTGNIIISHNVGGLNDITLNASSGTGSISSTASGHLTTPSLFLFADDGNIGDSTNAIRFSGFGGGNTIVTAQSSTGGDVFLDFDGTSSNAVTLSASSGNGDFTLTASNGGFVVVNGNVSGSGSLRINANDLSFTNNFNLDFGDITVTSLAGSGLTVTGDVTNGGTFTSDVGGNGVTFIATDGDLVTNNLLNFKGGDVFMTLANNDGVNAFINNGILRGDNPTPATNALTITARVVTLGTIQQFNPVTVINGHTIINSNGDVTLPANLIFHGESLAIIASGNITSTGATLIDLSSGTGDGGDLTVIAGVTTNPTSSGQEQTDQPFTITGFSTSGGNVNLSGVNIVTSSTAGSAGDVLILAAGGQTNAGTVTVGNITATGSVNGGLVAVGGKSNVSIGDITTTGGTGVAGDIALGVGTTTIVGTPVVTDGVLSGGSFNPTALSAGSLTFGNLNAGTSGNIALAGGFNAADAITSTGTVTGDHLQIIINAGTASLNNTSLNSFEAQTMGAGGGSIVLANEAGSLSVGDVTGTDLDVDITAGGAITVTDPVNVTTGTFTLESNQAGGSGIVVNAAVQGGTVNFDAGASNIDFAASTTASTAINLTGVDVTQTAGTLTAPTLGLFLTGDATLTTAVAALTNNGTADSLTLTNTGALQINNFDTVTDFDVTNSGAVNVAGAVTADGTASIDSGSTLSVAGTGSVSAGLGLSLTANNDITINGNVGTLDGTLQIVNDTGNINIGTGVAIQGDDSILINTAGNGTIAIGANANIFTDAKVVGQGNISIIQGAAPTKTRKLKVKNVVVVEQGGVALTGRGKGTKKVVASAPDNTVTAQGADVLIKASAKNGVTLGGGVTITADPPVSAGTPIVTRTWNDNSDSPKQPVQDISQTFASLSAASVSAPITTVTTNNAINLGGITETVSNLATANTHLASLAGQEDDSYMVTYAPMGTFADGQVCSDMEFGFASNGKAGIATMKHSDCVTLDKGSALFVPSKDMTVVTPKGSVKLAANAVAFVNVDNNQLSVYDINDHHKGSVVVSTGGRDLSLSPGRHIVVTHDRANQFADINPIESIMHRSVNRHELGAGKRAFTSEFSIPTAVKVMKPLSAMMQSNDAQAKKVAERVLKTSAVVLYMSGNAPFDFHAKPKTVALQW